MSLKSMNALQAIVALATGGKNDDLAKLAGTAVSVNNPSLKAALDRKMAKAQEEAAEEAAESILSIIKEAGSVIGGYVGRVRALRREEKGLLKKIKDMKRAIAYGNETGNWLPLGIATGSISEYSIREEAGKKATKIPDDWVAPKSAEEQVTGE